MIQHAIDVNNMEHRLKKQQNDIDQMKKKHTDDIQKLEAKYTQNTKKQADEIIKVTTKCAEDIHILRKHFNAKRQADIKKQKSDTATLIKAVADIKQQPSKYNHCFHVYLLPVVHNYSYTHT